MAKIDLKPLSLKELESLKSRVEKAIERHEVKRKADAVAELKAKAKELGFSLNDLVASAAPKPKAIAPKKRSTTPKKKVPAKVAYRHPDDASKTWIGLGPRPTWLKQELADGKQLADFNV
ncbi:H-NS histone family protein [Roseovarius aestuarii]|uniref:DNA binding protein, nucleoid-associated n=1 Tax=Roseovarius aestuarii TaxID=475083 RepID=A0A1X7BVX0_9RHOB|nr:H-NS histone family protein [Roseovarius aestuarii]SMC13812.1 DNA binding protein, nucleoid-associated [Roseovarius aestuarii]